MPTPVLDRPQRISRRKLLGAVRKCSSRGALPDDWDDWFPGAVPLLVPTLGRNITVANLIDYGRERVLHVGDPTRFIEAAQCFALLHHLGSPALPTIIDCEVA